MLPMLAWFIFILLIVLLAFLAIKFLALRIVLALLLTIPILVSFSYIVLRRSPVLTSNKNEFFANFHTASEGGAGQFNTITAFKQIKSNGGDTIKMDVRLTKDGMLILYREPTIADDTLVYTVEETHWVQMSKLKPYGGSTTILTFDEAVNWCETNKMNMLWHLPAYQSDLLTYLRNKILQDDLYSKVAVTTYNSVTALKIRVADTKLLIGLIWGSTEHSLKNGTVVGTMCTQWIYSALDSFGYWGIRSLLLPQFLGVDFLITSVGDADDELITEMQSNNINTVINGITTQNEKAYFVNQLELPILSEDIILVSNGRTNTTRNNATRSKN